MFHVDYIVSSLKHRQPHDNDWRQEDSKLSKTTIVTATCTIMKTMGRLV